MDLRRSGSKKQNQKAIDDVLGDLLAADDFDFDTPKQKKQSEKPKTKSSDDDFYSNLASAAGQPDESDISEADVSQVAKSLADLDDLDADLFGGKYNKKKSGSGTGTPRQRTPRTPRAISPPQKGGLARSSTLTSPPGSASGSRPTPQQAVKPSTAPSNITDLSRESEKLKPGDIKQERPRTVPKAKPKYNYGDFDEDDPLAGLLSDEDDDLDEAKTTRPNAPAQPDHVTSPGETSGMPEALRDREPLSPRRRRLMERPPTRSGELSDTGQASTDRLFESSSPAKPAPATGKPARKKEDVIFSDTEDDLLTGLEDEPKAKPKAVISAPAAEVAKPAKSALDSLLGKDTVSKHLERPQSGPQREFVLDKKYKKPAEEIEDDLLFGSYMPSMGGSAGGSRPGSRRSVRFEEADEPVSKPPSRGEKLGGEVKTGEKTSTSGLDWLELASSGGVASKPTEQSAKPDERRRRTSAGSDWLGLKDEEKEEDFDWLSPGPTLQSKAKTKAEPTVPTEDVKAQGAAREQPRTSTPAYKMSFEEDSYAFLHDDTSTSHKTPKEDTGDWLGLSSKPEPSRPRSHTPQSGGATQQQSHAVTGGITSGLLASTSPDSPAFGASTGAVRQRQLEKISESLFSTPDSPSLSSNLIKQEDTSTPSRGVARVPPPVAPSSVMGTTGTPSMPPLGGGGLNPLQHQITQVQDQLRLQMEEQVKLKQQEEQLALQQQQSQLEGMISQLQHQYQVNQMAKNTLSSYGSLAVPSHGLLSSAAHTSVRFDPQYTSMDNETKVRKLEIELECLQSRCDVNQRRYEEELTALEISYKNRIKVVEDSRCKLEERWGDDNERLLTKYRGQLRDLEEERAQLGRRAEAGERERQEEVDRLKDTHRKAISELKLQYEESLNRLRAVKNQEIDNITNAHSAAKSLQAVMQQVSSNAKDLGDLQYKVESWSKMGLDEREIFIRTKDEQLNMLQKRLDKQQEENGAERVRLQDLISRLEKQLADQSRTLDEEKWKLKQEQAKAVSSQNSLEEERRSWAEQQSRELAALDKAKDSLLQEQKLVLSQLYEERRSMAEERTQLNAAQRSQREREQQHAIKYVKADAEYEVTMKTVSEERSRSEARQREVEKAEELLRAQLAGLDAERARLQQEQSRVSELALELRHRSQEVDHMASSARQTHEEGSHALREAQKLQADQDHRSSQLQAQLSGLRTKEKDIAEERILLAKEKKEVEALRTSMLCVNCRTPVRDVGLTPSVTPHNNSVHSPHGAQLSPAVRTPSGVPVVSPLRTDLLTLAPGRQVSASAVGAISASIEADKSFRMWRMQADKDKEFLMEESMFLETLKQSPYSSSRLTS